jgi:hypothetical protein
LGVLRGKTRNGFGDCRRVSCQMDSGRSIGVAPVCARRFFDLSVGLLPASERERFSEEWCAHVESFPGSGFPSTQLVWAALEIRFFVVKDSIHQAWILFRGRAALFRFLAYCWLKMRLTRFFGMKKKENLCGTSAPATPSRIGLRAAHADRSGSNVVPLSDSLFRNFDGRISSSFSVGGRRMQGGNWIVAHRITPFTELYHIACNYDAFPAMPIP